MNELKLDNKRTVLVGLAFLSICAFWQMYDNVVPLILRETFGMDEFLAGVIMAADNILARLLLLPLLPMLCQLYVCIAANHAVLPLDLEGERLKVHAVVYKQLSYVRASMFHASLKRVIVAGADLHSKVQQNLELPFCVPPPAPDHGPQYMISVHAGARHHFRDAHLPADRPYFQQVLRRREDFLLGAALHDLFR